MGFPAQNSMSIFARGAFGSCSAKIYLYPSYKKKKYFILYILIFNSVDFSYSKKSFHR